ncbi:hypothetical protein JYU34_003450 [Plutella xylostella]|uniref:F-box domain-containing protein n=1 Tax=Plutella xylostella TaxID=51655 RepID=A0ABQ7R029_PLUXY|nr:hypothetical protein JYU34_003450 [Plutella xylostella]
MFKSHHTYFEMDLPYEVLVYLFKYLPPSDRQAASETCRTWYAAASDQCFVDNKAVVFYKAELYDGQEPLDILVKSPVDFSNFVFSDVEVSNKTKGFWDTLGENIKGITLRSCDTCEKMFVYIIEKCPNLEVLRIESCRELFMSGRLLEGKSDGITANSLENLKVLSLTENQYLTDALVSRFTDAAPKLEELDLSGCSLQFHLGLVKRFYPTTIENKPLTPSESVLTFYFVLQVIISRAPQMKRLKFSSTLIDGSALKLLADVEDLRLESLEMFGCDQLTNSGIVKLISYQTSLKVLNIGMCSRVTDQSVVNICRNLVNLESLNIQRCRAVTDLGIVELNKLKKLKTLNISQCELITKEGLENGLLSMKNEILEEFDIHSLNLDESGLIMISEKLPNLRSLDISYCFNAVTDKSIQLIFKNQVWLLCLKMSHCDKVTDAGLTGMGKAHDDEEAVVSNYDQCYTHHKIHLGSRAEEEILRDARRKRDVKKLCEKYSSDSYTGYSLERLKSLRELDISGCNKITDVSLTYAFYFKELAHLNMSMCQQVTHKGIEHLVKNCPSIEYFNLIDCYNLKDEAIKVIVKGLKRLKSLNLRGCNQLTNKTIDAVRDNCKKLKFLDVQGCRAISAETACTIGNIPTLHTVLVSKPTNYMTEDGLKDRAPAPTFLPALMRKLLSRRSP